MKLVLEIKTDLVVLGIITVAAIIGLSNIGVAHNNLSLPIAVKVGITLISLIVVT